MAKGEDKSWLEKLQGKDVRTVTKYECEKYSGEELPQVVTFVDGSQKVSCEFLSLGVCPKCDYFDPL